MPQPIHHDQDDNAAGEVVLGVDTHKDLHAAAVINPLGVLLSSEIFPATAAGYRALLVWAGRFGTVRQAGVECTGSYGAALARHLRAAGVKVIEVNQPEEATRPRRGKTDTLDAEAAARAVLSGRASGSAKAGGDAANVQAGQGLRHQGPHPDDQPTRKPCSSRPTRSCAKPSPG